MAPRAQLSQLLNALADNVYFQPPANVQMKFPCIVYKRAQADTRYAGDRSYLLTFRYSLTVIDRNPDSPLVAQVAKLPMCRHTTFFVADNLNHDVFDLYF